MSWVMHTEQLGINKTSFMIQTCRWVSLLHNHSTKSFLVTLTSECLVPLDAGIHIFPGAPRYTVLTYVLSFNPHKECMRLAVLSSLEDCPGHTINNWQSQYSNPGGCDSKASPHIASRFKSAPQFFAGLLCQQLKFRLKIYFVLRRKPFLQAIFYQCLCGNSTYL